MNLIASTDLWLTLDLRCSFMLVLKFNTYQDYDELLVNVYRLQTFCILSSVNFSLLNFKKRLKHTIHLEVMICTGREKKKKEICR